MKGIYYQTVNGEIFKYRESHDDYLKCSPWKDGEDRRYNWGELDNPTRINKNVAARVINEQWRNITQHWAWRGKKYETRGQCFSGKSEHEHIWEFDGKRHTYKTIEYDDCFGLCPKHVWHHSHDWTDRNGEIHHHEYDYTYYLVMYQGKLIWATNSQYCPQVYYYKFEDINTEPLGSKFMGWTNINCIKPVFCITDKKYI